MKNIALRCLRTAFVLGALLIVSSCSKSDSDENLPTNPEEPTIDLESQQIPILISTGIWTRATDTSYEEGDHGGIYVVNQEKVKQQLLVEGNHVDNMMFKLTNGKWEPKEPIYWKDDKTIADFYCYYPYIPSIDNLELPFSVSKDQSEEANYKASDFLWGKSLGVAPTEEPVQLTTNHVMSNLFIYIKAGKGYKQDEIDAFEKKVVICNTKPNATINLSTGIAHPVGAVSNITPLKIDEYYRALLVPQEVQSSDFIKLTMNGKDYLLKQSILLKSNKQYKCTLTVNRVSNGFDVNIGEWIEDDMDYGGTVE